MSQISVPSSTQLSTGPNVRVRDDSDDTLELDVDLAPKKKRRTNPESLRTKGAHYTVMVDMWRDIETVVETGLRVRGAQGAAQDRFSVQEHRYYKIFEELKRSIMTDIDARIRQGGESALASICAGLVSGQTSLRNTVSHAIKKVMLKWAGVTDLDTNDKVHRGFHHDVCGRLLCPVTYDWDDERVRLGLQTGNARYKAGPKDWMFFLWADAKVVPGDMFEGFCRGELLVQTLTYVLFGPKAGDAVKGKTIHNSGAIKNAGKNSRPRAVTWRVKKVTLPAIAFAAVFVHFGLSNQENFSSGGAGGKFPYQAFYQQLVYFLEDTFPSEHREALLEWWNRRIFSGLSSDSDGNDEVNDDGDENVGSSSAMAQMYAQAKAAVGRGVTTGAPGAFGDVGTNRS